MLYRFGRFDAQDLKSAEEVENLLGEAETCRASFSDTSLQEILTVIDRVGKLWLPDGKYFARALQEVARELSFSQSMIEHTLRLIPSLCDQKQLSRRLVVEFGMPEMLDGFVAKPGYAGRVHAAPFGTLLHVAAGNVFIGCIDSLINGFVTKNVSIMKLSGKNQRFPILFAESIVEADPEKIIADKFALVYWPGGKQEVEDRFKSRVNAIIAWGGQKMIESYRQGLGAGTSLIEHGPKISFQVVFKEAFDQKSKGPNGLKELAQNIARDLSLWDQSACSSPQNLFVQKGITPKDRKALMTAIGEALDQVEWERGELSADEHVEILKEQALATYHELMEGGALLQGRDWLLSFDPRPGLRSSPLNRTLILKTFESLEELGSQIAPFSPFLQSCGYLATNKDRNSLLSQGAVWGICRFAPIGQMMAALEGSPHDGRYGWAELTRLVSDENPVALSVRPDETTQRLIAFVNRAIREVPAYEKLYEKKQIRALPELRPISSSFFAENSLHRSNALLKKEPDAGYIFSSGGTSGNPKYAYYSHEEFKFVGKMLSQGFKAQGIGKGTLSANLFVAGNLWSSFLAVDQALAACEARVLPIGGNAEADLILKYLAEFKPELVVGLPSLLVSLLNRACELKLDLEIPQICYAGEHLNAQAKKLFVTRWKTKHFGSAGYASVDAGPIGHQCAHCGPGEHHLFSEFVHLEIVEDEAVVTSLVRRNMPVIHLKTGDHVSWSGTEGACACGSPEPKFVLHGRCDGQMNLWSCRLLLSEVEAALLEAGIEEPSYQVCIEELIQGDALIELLTVSIETENAKYEGLSQAFGSHLHRLSKDVHATHPSAYVEGRVALKSVKPGTLLRVARTGKLPRIRDLRA